MRHAAWRWLFSWRRLSGLGALVAAGALASARSRRRPPVPPHRRARRAARAGLAARRGARRTSRPASSWRWGCTARPCAALQKRLAALKYYPGPADGQFGLDTLEAVWAFKEVQGYPVNSANEDVVSRATERALVHPRSPQVLVPRGGSMRIEVNMRQRDPGPVQPQQGRADQPRFHRRRLPARARLRLEHPDRQFPDNLVLPGWIHRAARGDVQPGVLHRLDISPFTGN